MNVEVWADGAVKDNGKPTAIAGWGFAILVDGELVAEGSGRMKTEEGVVPEDYESNNTGELTAVIMGLSYLPHPCKVRVISDSAYVVNCFKQRWYIGWRRRNWFKSDGEPVKNRKYWEKLLDKNDEHEITWEHVKGHAGIEWNEYVDKLAKRGIIEGHRVQIYGAYEETFKRVPAIEKETPVMLSDDGAEIDLDF